MIVEKAEAQKMNISEIIVRKQDGSAVKLAVKIPETETQLLQGLMYVEKLVGYDGMLLDFGESKFLNMWMKNTFIPLDMLFFDSAHRLIYIHENAMPHDCSSLGCIESRYVLEIDGGRARELGITIGDSFNK